MTKATFTDPAFQGYVIPGAYAGRDEPDRQQHGAGEIVFSSTFDSATTLHAMGSGITVNGGGHVTGGPVTLLDVVVNGPMVGWLTEFGKAMTVCLAGADQLTGRADLIDLGFDVNVLRDRVQHFNGDPDRGLCAGACRIAAQADHQVISPSLEAVWLPRPRFSA